MSPVTIFRIVHEETGWNEVQDAARRLLSSLNREARHYRQVAER